MMVVGIDTYDDAAVKGGCVGAFICSMNSSFTRYYSRCGVYSSKVELHHAFIVRVQGKCLVLPPFD